jgi:hypothetical protein
MVEPWRLNTATNTFLGNPDRSILTATLLSLSLKTRICEGISLLFEFSVGEDGGGTGVVMQPHPDEQPHMYGLSLSAACYIRVQRRRWGQHTLDYEMLVSKESAGSF